MTVGRGQVRLLRSVSVRVSIVTRKYAKQPSAALLISTCVARRNLLPQKHHASLKQISRWYISTITYTCDSSLKRLTCTKERRKTTTAERTACHWPSTKSNPYTTITEIQSDALLHALSKLMYM